MRISDWSSDVCSSDWLTSGGLGTMGYGFPAAVGAQIAHPDRLVVCIAGEASLQMNIQEMGTVAQYRLPVKIFILNNQWMGMVRQWQELTYESRYSNSYSDSLPDFVKLADRSEEHTSELQSLMRISYAVFCLKKKNNKRQQYHSNPNS